MKLKNEGVVSKIVWGRLYKKLCKINCHHMKDYAKCPIYQFLKISHHWNYCSNCFKTSTSNNNTSTCPLLKKVQSLGNFFSTQSSFWMPRIFFKYMILIIEARLPWGVWNLAHENVADLEHLRRRKRRIIIIVMRSCRAADLCHVQPMSFWEKIKGAASIRAQKLTLYVCSLCRLTLLICLKFCVNGGAYVDWPFWSASNFVWMEEHM